MRGWARTALLGMVVSTTAAHADRIAVESYVGGRPANSERVLASIRPVLEQHGFVVDPVLTRRRFEAHVWRSGGARSAGAAIFKKIEAGAGEFDDAKLDAVKTLRAGVDLARANPVAWANEPKFRDQVRRGLLVYALALTLRAKDEREESRREKGKRQIEITQRAAADEQARDEAMDDLLRNFPAFVVKGNEYGAQAEALFQEASKRARQNGGGSIELDVDDPNVIVYVDESQQPRKTTIGNIVAGRHRVLVVSAAESREYSIDVLPNRRSRVVVRWRLDSVLKLGDWAGFAFASESERQQESELLTLLVGTSGSIDIAATLTVNADGSSLIGRSYNMRSGKPLASCTLAVVSRRPNADAAEQFARCLTTEQDNRRPATAGGARTATTGATPTNTGATSTNAGVTSTNAPAHSAVAAAVVDAGENRQREEVDEDGGDMRRDQGASHRWMLWTAIGSFGVTAIGGGLTAKFVLDGRSAGDELGRVCAVMCTSEQANALIANQDTANRRAWIAAGVSGAALVGGVVLVVLWSRSGRTTAVPTAQLVRGGASVGWSFDF